MTRVRSSLRESVSTLFAFACVACLILFLVAPRLIAKNGAKIFAQQLVETALTKHPELSGVELSVTPPGGQNCLTIASTTRELRNRFPREPRYLSPWVNGLYSGAP